MGDTKPIDGGQTALWNGPAGRGWVDMQALTDRVYQPIEDLLVDAVVAVSRGAVLDVGCGTGGTTVAIARRLGTESRCTGVDISEPMMPPPVPVSSATARRRGSSAPTRRPTRSSRPPSTRSCRASA